MFDTIHLPLIAHDVIAITYMLWKNKKKGWTKMHEWYTTAKCEGDCREEIITYEDEKNYLEKGFVPFMKFDFTTKTEKALAFS